MRNRIIQFFGVLLLFLTITSLDNKVCAQEADSLSKEKIDIQHIIFSHTDDSYEWHITNIGEKEINYDPDKLLGAMFRFDGRKTNNQIQFKSKTKRLKLNFEDFTIFFPNNQFPAISEQAK